MTRILITGATGGLGRSLARRLAGAGDAGAIVLAARSAERAETLRAELQTEFPDVGFSVSVIDTESSASVRAAVAQMQEPLDGIVLNAGGTGGPRPAARTADGVNVVFASNTVGHVLLVELLLERGLLAGTVELVGSEAAFGVPALRMPAPAIRDGSVAEFRSWVEGVEPFDPALAYGQAKLLGALWIGALARRHPQLRAVAVSPGNTSGTGVLRELPLPVRVIVPRLNRLLGRMHSLADGTERLAAGLLDAAYRSGRFYASAEGRLTGALVDQAGAHPELADPALQDAAFEALSCVTERSPADAS
jgi:NAD(P)-dependent dehydrogenase (short-subunit alcohol dehydrogenase family)